MPKIEIPTMVKLPTIVFSIDAGQNHSVVNDVNGDTYVWGYNAMGQLGIGNTDTKTLPVKLTTVKGLVEVSGRNNHTTALMYDGTVWSWGSNMYGESGNADTNRALPVRILDKQIVLQINNPYMYVNGAKSEIDPGKGTSPLVKENKTLIPIRAVIEALGGTIEWNGAESKITVLLKGKTIELWLNSTKTMVNGVEKPIEVAPKTFNGRTVIPLRYVIENLGYTVEWNNSTKEIFIFFL